jgi:ankyrin repeat protein
MLLNHGADINVMCKQKYTPFLLAVRLGNIDMVSKLLQILIAERGLMTSEDLSAKTGNGLNTALHIAAAKTNYQVIFELDKWGADIFVRNRENKTCF